MRYVILKGDGVWNVHRTYTYYQHDKIEDDIEFSSSSLADCYAWIKATEENLIR